MGTTKLISPALLQRHLHKVAYPATRAELVAHARDEYERVVGALGQLPDRRYSRPADVSRAFAEVVGGHIDGAAYPARREDLIACAERRQAARPVIEALRRIPDRRYDGPEAVSEAIAEEEE
jgi:hypothetical protein